MPAFTTGQLAVPTFAVGQSHMTENNEKYIYTSWKLNTQYSQLAVPTFTVGQSKCPL